MNCDESQELLLEFSLGQLDTRRMNEVREHLHKGCIVCAKELTETVEAWARLATNLEPVKPSPEVESKLLAMIRGEVPAPVELSRQQAKNTIDTPKISWLKAYVLAASLLGVAAGLITWNFTPLGHTLVRVDRPAMPQENWGDTRPNDASTGFRTVSFEPLAETKGLRLTAVVSQQTEEWHIIGTGLPAAKMGDIFRIWFETKSGKFLGNTLPVGKAGKGGLVVAMPTAEHANLASLWLTVETSAETERPSDKVLFRGSIK
jgi:hypothetical protein